MWQLALLAAQLLSQAQQKKAARADEVAKLEAQRAARFGGNTAPIEAATFNRDLNRQTFFTPQNLLASYGAISSLGGGNQVSPQQSIDNAGAIGSLPDGGYQLSDPSSSLTVPQSSFGGADPYSPTAMQGGDLRLPQSSGPSLFGDDDQRPRLRLGGL